MLVIRRRIGETFRIGDDVEVQILDATGGQVKIGITAPKEIPVLRNEVWVTARQNQMAASAAASAAVAEALTETLVRQILGTSPNSSSNSK